MSVSSDRRQSSTTFNGSIVFSFEASFNPNETIEWVSQHRHEAFYYIGVHAKWNMMLSTFSIIGLCRITPGTIFALQHFDVRYLACNIVFDRPYAFWTWLFVLSKVLELGDTVFIVLRKQLLTFLHWYHHITVLLFSWYYYSAYIAPARWFMVMNYLAHSLMYPYYTLRAMRISVPNIIAMMITSVQAIQMLIGFYIFYVAYTALNEGRYCYCPKHLAICGMIMYLSYLVLFLRLFCQKYLAVKTKDI